MAPSLELGAFAPQAKVIYAKERRRSTTMKDDVRGVLHRTRRHPGRALRMRFRRAAGCLYIFAAWRRRAPGHAGLESVISDEMDSTLILSVPIAAFASTSRWLCSASRRTIASLSILSFLEVEEPSMAYLSRFAVVVCPRMNTARLSRLSNAARAVIFRSSAHSVSHSRRRQQARSTSPASG